MKRVSCLVTHYDGSVITLGVLGTQCLRIIDVTQSESPITSDVHYGNHQAHVTTEDLKSG